MEFTNSQQDRFYAHGGPGGLFTGQMVVLVSLSLVVILQLVYVKETASYCLYVICNIRTRGECFHKFHGY